MNFYLNNEANSEIERINVIFLFHSSWDDWFTYSTLYSVYYYDSEGLRHHIGSVKIGEFNMESRKRTPGLPNSFEVLEESFFSLGQDVSYYERLSLISVDFRDEVLNALNDIALKTNLYKKSLKENVTRISLLRDVSTTSVEGQFRRLATGNAELTPYSFKFHLPKHPKSQVNDMILDFNVIPKSNPPSNINVIIGRNGVGKTHLFNSMISSLLGGNRKTGRNGFFTNSLDESKNPFSNLISVSFSAFDETNPIVERRDKTKYLNYSYIGLKRVEKNNDRPKSPTILKNEFVKSIEKCKLQGKKTRWINAVKVLEADPVFNESEISQILEIENNSDLKNKAPIIFNKLSSGHKIVLLTITQIVETIEERSLVLLDEPEGYLHPPLLSAFIRALSDILIQRNAVAIIGTHSPVVLQEVPKSSVWKLRRHGANAIAERLEIESFGENVGLLTQEVFGLEVTHSGFHNILKSIVQNSNSFEEAISSLDNKIGQEGKAILRTLMYNK
ncbi:AAA family ATPase [Flagellimonas myxillae]|uniref:AAA family ATPase n=1 Tax=Flagellimonas myxillae TaxID=2942214 RepID=UPI00201F7F2C|nr:AAA family ATPase [Muricauda myxillae]MCL6264915.1 ATP-binding protein [Muricauda myxillae]